MSKEKVHTYTLRCGKREVECEFGFISNKRVIDIISDFHGIFPYPTQDDNSEEITFSFEKP